MGKLVATRVFYSYHGYSDDGTLVSFGNGEIDARDLSGVSMIEHCLELAKKSNRRVANIHLLAVTPLLFETVEGDVL
jgi:hypothetical protein